MRIGMFGLVLGLLACGTAGDGLAGEAPGAVLEQQKQAPQDTVLYLDVRTLEEYRGGHVKGAVLIPYDQMEQRWRELEAHRDRPIVLYCRSGRRAGVALEVLKAHGFTKVTNGGGVEQMQARGLPIATGQ